MVSRRAARRSVLTGAVILAMLISTPVGFADGTDEDDPFTDNEQIISIAFPTIAEAWFIDDYHHPRGGGARVHMATDLMGEQMWPLFAAVDGTICFMNGLDGPPPSWGFALTICDEDGRRYRYIHINDDTPGTSDMSGLHQYAYAPASHPGATVRRGQLVAWMGDSGNAKGGTPHLHFEIFDETVTGPYEEDRINPYNSLVAALERGEIPDGRVPLDAACPGIDGSERFSDVSGSEYEASIACVSAWQIALGREDGTFGPHDLLTRGQMASFLTRLLDATGLTLPDGDGLTVIDYTDIAGHTHEAAIRQISAVGVANGYGDGLFGPNDRLTRAQITSFAVRTYEEVAGRSLPAPRDVFLDDDGSVHEDAINAAAAARLVDAATPGHFAPGRAVSRQEMADLIARLLDLLVADGFIDN
jgi:murein DD-endopeptidase MepM/ murein hydrolase activator NlpD